MARVIEMPKLSDTMEEGGVANWLKKEGEPVKEGEPLVEIETDKATQEYESPEEGILLKILVSPGKTVALRTPIAVVGDKGEKVDVAALTASAPQAAAPATPVVPTPAPAAPRAPAPAASHAGIRAVPPPAATSPQAATSEGRLKSSPLARKVASEHGLDLATLHGSGPGGRVVARDVEQALAAGVAPALGQPAPAAGGTQAPVATGEERAIPNSMMRKTIAKRLTAAKNEAPHFYLTVSANVAGLQTWRVRLNEDAAKSGGKLAKVSVNDLVILAVSRALRRHPMVNASWQGDTTVQHGSVHVAVAVALPEGLVTPVIRHADVLGVREIARQSRELALKAKEGRATNEDYAGGTFAISNLGMFGIEEFTAIIPPGMAGILAVGAAMTVPWVDAQGQVVAQQRMKMTMSCDHRVVDGATGAEFLATLVSFLEDPLTMMV